MLQLTQINIYPVKSLDGYSPKSAVVEARGLQYDRRWMIVNAEGHFFTQRTKHKMAQLRASIENEQLIIAEKAKPSHSITVSIHAIGEKITVEVWDDSVVAAKVSADADAFLSDFLGEPCHLVVMPESSDRLVEADYNRGDDVVSFADGFPYLIIGEASINDLNERLETPLNTDNQALIGARRFRANFIFSGGTPYEEESWSKYRIGEVDFLGMKPCGRCVMTTLDPDTGKGGKEPLATLANYRKSGRKIMFGQNTIWDKNRWNWAFAPEVTVGDVLTVN